MNNTVFRNCSQQLNELLSSQSADKVIIVPVDFAKNKHVAKIGLGTGEYLHKRALIIHNNSTGIDFLEEWIEKFCQKLRIPKRNVIIATEDPHSYAKGFFQHLKDKGYLVVQVNALNAKRFRNHSMASSDKIDLDGIFNAVLNRQANDLKGQYAVYEAMRLAIRTYQSLIKQSTRCKNQINKLVDRVFPGFLSKKHSGLEPFGAASLALLRKGTTAATLKKRNRRSLLKFLQKHHIKDTASVVDKLKALSEESLASDPELETYLAELLATQVERYLDLRPAIQNTLDLCAKLLLKTPYCLLTSIPGIALVRAAVLAGEYGAPENLRNKQKMCAYAGIVPGTEQSGGPDKAPAVVGLPNKCNRRLKNALVSAAHDQNNYGHPAGRHVPEFKEHRLRRHYHKVSARNGKSGISTARLMVKTMRKMLKEHQIYLPQGDIAPEKLAIYVECSFNSMCSNFRKEIIDTVPPDENILLKTGKEWKETMKVFHGIEINLPF